MRIRILGSGAADGIPGMFSEDPVSKHARCVGGKDYRTRCSAIIDDCLQLDMPPDIYSQLAREKLSAADWTAVVFTHTHHDHFAIDEIQYALFPFTPYEHLPFTIYGNSTVCELISARYPEWPIEVVMTTSFQSFQHGPYLITPIRAYHKLDEDSHNLIIQKKGKTFLYGTDTGYWREETWEYLKDFRVDHLVLECADGFADRGYYGHLNIPKCIDMVERLRKQGTLANETPVTTTHHSYQGLATNDQLLEALAPHGIVPGYDGQIIDL